ncbi:MAG: T9SS type A sorting domain-containing protein [Bacteroidales bacterium]
MYQQNGYVGLRIDSVKLHNNDFVFYPNVNLLFLRDTFRVDGSWIGKRVVVKSNGDNCFINKDGDSILLKTKAVLKDSWTAYSKGNLLIITAEVTGYEKSMFLGLEDSVKTITFHVFDATMKPKPNGYDGKQIKISKHYGIVESKSFYIFPNEIDNSFDLNFTLAGMTNPKVGVQNLTANDIWDYNEGDEYHILDVHSDMFDSYIDSTFYINKIVKREQKDDSITYSFDQKYKYVSIRKYPNPSKNIEIGTRSFKWSPFSEKSLNLLSGEIMISDYDILVTSMPTLNIKMQFNHLVQPIDSVTFTYGCCEDPPAQPSLYYRGFGGSYRMSNSFPDIPHAVVYYKKNNVEWGKKLVITGIQSVRKENSIRVSSIIARKELIANIASSELPARLELLSVSGTVVFGKSIDTESSTISLQSLPAGAYLYRVRGDNGRVVSGKVILN